MSTDDVQIVAAAPNWNIPNIGPGRRAYQKWYCYGYGHHAVQGLLVVFPFTFQWRVYFFMEMMSQIVGRQCWVLLNWTFGSLRESRRQKIDHHSPHLCIWLDSYGQKGLTFWCHPSFVNLTIRSQLIVFFSVLPRTRCDTTIYILNPEYMALCNQE
jgi:hypothetical protein